MNLKLLCCACLPLMLVLSLFSCEKKQKDEANFTRADSLTETYLALQDAMVQVWNSMMHDDNRKLRSLGHLIHELGVTTTGKEDTLLRLDQWLSDLKSMRYNQHTMQDPSVITGYDSASRSLTSEVIGLAEAQREYAYNTTMQKLVENIRAADRRVARFRDEYDRIAVRFNAFIANNAALLDEIDEDSISIKPLFSVAAE